MYTRRIRGRSGGGLCVSEARRVEFKSPPPDLPRMRPSCPATPLNSTKCELPSQDYTKPKQSQEFQQHPPYTALISNAAAINAFVYSVCGRSKTSRASPCSTTTPSFITINSLASARTTRRS